MRLSQAWIVASHDLTLFRHRRGLFYGLIVFPLAVAVGFPFVTQYILRRAGSEPFPPALLGGLIDSFSFFFIIAAASLPAAIAAYSIVGEKIEKSLEPLLSTPTTDGEILFGKALAAFLPTIAAIWAGSAIFMVLMDRVTEPTLGHLYYPNWGIAVILLALAPPRLPLLDRGLHPRLGPGDGSEDRAAVLGPPVPSIRPPLRHGRDRRGGAQHDEPPLHRGRARARRHRPLLPQPQDLPSGADTHPLEVESRATGPVRRREHGVHPGKTGRWFPKPFGSRPMVSGALPRARGRP